MKGYWLRVFGAWVLLRFASAVMKDAEKVLRQASVKLESDENG